MKSTAQELLSVSGLTAGMVSRILVSDVADDPFHLITDKDMHDLRHPERLGFFSTKRGNSLRRTSEDIPFTSLTILDGGRVGENPKRRWTWFVWLWSRGVKVIPSTEWMVLPEK